MVKCRREISSSDKPKWSDHNYPAICMCGSYNWFGLHEAVKPFYSDEWKGKEVTLLRGQSGFIKRGKNPSNKDIEGFYEVRPEHSG